MKISIICAMDKKRGIGKDNKLLWNIPEDLKRFKELTSGHPIIMGRKTFESIGRVLPDRTNIIITHNSSLIIPNSIIVHSLDEAIKKAHHVIASEAKQSRPKQIAAVVDDSLAMTNENEVFIIGGGQIFQQALPLASKLYLTIVDGEFEADTFFPDYPMFAKKTFEQKGESGEYIYTFVDLER